MAMSWQVNSSCGIYLGSTMYSSTFQGYRKFSSAEKTFSRNYFLIWLWTLTEFFLHYCWLRYPLGILWVLRLTKMITWWWNSHCSQTCLRGSNLGVFNNGCSFPRFFHTVGIQVFMLHKNPAIVIPVSGFLKKGTVEVLNRSSQARLYRALLSSQISQIMLTNYILQCEFHPTFPLHFKFLLKN